MPRHLEIAAHYEACLAAHGDSHLGVDWPKEEDTRTRHEVMLELIPDLRLPHPEPCSLLDLGCGCGHLLEHLRNTARPWIDYVGLDISERFVDLCRTKFPDRTFHRADLLEGHDFLPEFDYLVCNGVFTEKRSLTYAEMFRFFQDLLSAAWPHVRRGLAFNVMSKHVDWERPDLFHLPYDEAAAFLKTHLSRHIRIRADYGLYEYTVYVYRTPITTHV
jgi:SAM-dependent methyltransferase